MASGSDRRCWLRLAWLVPGAALLAMLGTCSTPPVNGPEKSPQLTLINLTNFPWEIEARDGEGLREVVQVPPSEHRTLQLPAGRYAFRHVAHAPTGVMTRWVTAQLEPRTTYEWPLATLLGTNENEALAAP